MTNVNGVQTGRNKRTGFPLLLQDGKSEPTWQEKNSIVRRFCAPLPKGCLRPRDGVRGRETGKRRGRKTA